MKITKARLKEIVKEEVIEALRPRIDIGSSGLQPRVGKYSRSPEVTPAPPPSEKPPIADESALRDKLMSMVMSYYKVSQADNSVPEHVLRAFERLAQEIAKG